MANFLAAVEPHSRNWFLTLPISSCGLRLADEAVRVAVVLRLGCSVCIAHTMWRCAAGAQGLHGLVCYHAPSKTVRQKAINDVTARAVTSAGIPVTKEPVGLTRLDGKRPDGLTLIPWQCGESLTWNVTVVSTLTDFSTVSTRYNQLFNRLDNRLYRLNGCHLHASTQSAGGDAEIASARKESKHSLLPSD